jgi:hypothetical protein
VVRSSSVDAGIAALARLSEVAADGHVPLDALFVLWWATLDSNQ